MTIDRKPFPIDDITSMIDRCEQFTFSRWGDGEWRSVLRQHGSGAANCDGSPFRPEMRQRLNDILVSKPPYIMGLQSFAMRLCGEKLFRYIQENKLEGLDWRESDALHYAMLSGVPPEKFESFLVALRKRPILMVGAAHLRNLKLFDTERFFLVDGRRAFDQLPNTMSSLTGFLDAATKSHVVLASCGMSAEVLLHDLYDRYKDAHTFLDAGSVWDLFVGKKSRSYMRKKREHPMPK